ncbi:hypothetical protein K449DRAFT_141112 [Hypoxylon sp. EC38]|nr:hypothetical protein K449DRAFT_141112 [Hypoxylon sp. EC38]
METPHLATKKKEIKKRQKEGVKKIRRKSLLEASLLAHHPAFDTSHFQRCHFRTLHIERCLDCHWIALLLCVIFSRCHRCYICRSRVN